MQVVNLSGSRRGKRSVEVNLQKKELQGKLPEDEILKTKKKKKDKQQ
jgi:hypothetical protein